MAAYPLELDKRSSDTTDPRLQVLSRLTKINDACEIALLGFSVEQLHTEFSEIDIPRLRKDPRKFPLPQSMCLPRAFGKVLKHPLDGITFHQAVASGVCRTDIETAGRTGSFIDLTDQNLPPHEFVEALGVRCIETCFKYSRQMRPSEHLPLFAMHMEVIGNIKVGKSNYEFGIKGDSDDCDASISLDCPASVLATGLFRWWRDATKSLSRVKNPVPRFARAQGNYLI